jgi:hypothetical protein
MANPADSLPADVVDALKGGNKIEAIKRFRVATGAGLAEAKAAIEAAEGHKTLTISAHVEIGPRKPGLAPGEVPKTNRNAMAFIVVAVLAALAGWLFAKFG